MFRGAPGALAQAPERASSQSLPVVICAADEVEPPGTSARDSTFADARPPGKRATWLLWTHEVGWANWLHMSLARGSVLTWRARVAAALQSFGHAPGQPPGGAAASGGRLQGAPRFAIAFGVICLLLFMSQMAAGGARWLPSAWMVCLPPTLMPHGTYPALACGVETGSGGEKEEL
jgi:hypothetical protein